MDSILTVAGITGILVTIVTLVFQYFPGLRVKWAGIATEYKRGIIFALYVIVGAIVGFGGCVEAIAAILPQLLCSTATGFGEYVVGVLLAVGAGQGIFDLLPETADVLAAKAAR